MRVRWTRRALDEIVGAVKSTRAWLLTVLLRVAVGGVAALALSCGRSEIPAPQWDTPTGALAASLIVDHFTQDCRPGAGGRIEMVVRVRTLVQDVMFVGGDIVSETGTQLRTFDVVPSASDVGSEVTRVEAVPDSFVPNGVCDLCGSTGSTPAERVRVRVIVTRPARDPFSAYTQPAHSVLVTPRCIF